MLLNDMKRAVLTLSVPEQLELLETVTRSLRTSLPTPVSHVSIHEREAIVDQLFGALVMPGKTTTDEQIRHDYDEYLSRKYS